MRGTRGVQQEHGTSTLLSPLYPCSLCPLTLFTTSSAFLCNDRTLVAITFEVTNRASPEFGSEIRGMNLVISQMGNSSQSGTPTK